MKRSRLQWTPATLSDVSGWKAERHDKQAFYFISESTGAVGVFLRGAREWTRASDFARLAALEDHHRWYESEGLDLSPGIVPTVEHLYI